MRLSPVWLILILILITSTVYAQAEENRTMSETNLIARHQRCVLQAFIENAKNSRGFDPNLIDESVGQCEAMLEPLKNSIIARTRDARFAESVLAKIREASRRGAAVALVGYLAKKKQARDGEPRQ